MRDERKHTTKNGNPNAFFSLSLSDNFLSESKRKWGKTKQVATRDNGHQGKKNKRRTNSRQYQTRHFILLTCEVRFGTSFFVESVNKNFSSLSFVVSPITIRDFVFRSHSEQIPFLLLLQFLTSWCFPLEFGEKGDNLDKKNKKKNKQTKKKTLRENLHANQKEGRNGKKGNETGTRNT